MAASPFSAPGTTATNLPRITRRISTLPKDEVEKRSHGSQSVYLYQQSTSRPPITGRSAGKDKGNSGGYSFFPALILTNRVMPNARTAATCTPTMIKSQLTTVPLPLSPSPSAFPLSVADASPTTLL